MTKRLIIFFVLILILGSIFIKNITKEQPVKFNVNENLSFENATIYHESVLSNDHLYPIHRSSNNVWIETKLSRKGRNSMAFQLQPGESRKETKVLNIPNNTIKYVAFSVYFPSDYQIPTDWNLFAQWWQGSLASPPVAFQIDPNSTDFRISIVTRDGTSKKFNRICHYNESINRDEWIDFIIKLRVDDNNGSSGLLKVWKNNQLIVNYSGALGYSDLNVNTNFRFGLYRSPNNTSKVEAYYDEILVGEELPMRK
ncbi:hypothetical protein GW626_14895 [Peribacillus muralis]|uniref:heparin lyase I family protein n=1 Tax=Peribacillus muralis TaxID=264697 RepID=UPI001F4DA351|nr:heparin lyase I family protein [Peribacillus muralis]MCK1991632.1 polysaccharide lyase [Peribacillus muralis]MCK2012191.1 polysaccharide lyase [Peribacillus muralis]